MVNVEQVKRKLYQLQLEKLRREVARSGIDPKLLLTLAQALDKQRAKSARIAMLLYLKDCIDSLLMGECYEV
jgi:hypothetical protein